MPSSASGISYCVNVRAVMIPIFLEPIPEPAPQTKRAITGADSTLESVPVVEPAPVLESAPRVESAPEYEPPFFSRNRLKNNQE